MHSLLANTISSFFDDLAPLPLPYTELIKLSNSQLIPALTYRLIYNSLPENLLNSLDSAIWSYVSKQGHLSKLTPTKTKYGNRTRSQLGITSLKLKVHQQTVNHITRYLLKKGPKPINEAVLYALSQPASSPNLLQSFSVDSENFTTYPCTTSQTQTQPHSPPSLSTPPSKFSLSASSQPQPQLPTPIPAQRLTPHPANDGQQVPSSNKTPHPQK